MVTIGRHTSHRDWTLLHTSWLIFSSILNPNAIYSRMNTFVLPWRSAEKMRETSWLFFSAFEKRSFLLRFSWWTSYLPALTIKYRQQELGQWGTCAAWTNRDPSMNSRIQSRRTRRCPADMRDRSSRAWAWTLLFKSSRSRHLKLLLLLWDIAFINRTGLTHVR